MNQPSLLMAAMYRFTGLRISGAASNKRPVNSPAGWGRIEIQRLWIHGPPYHLVAEDGKQAILHLAD